MVAAVTSLSCSDTVRSEGSGTSRVHPLAQGLVMRCRFLQEAAGEAQSPVCGTTGRGCVWSQTSSSLTMLCCRIEVRGTHWSAFPGIVRSSLSCSLRLRSPVGVRGKGMKSVRGARTEGEAITPVGVDLGWGFRAPDPQPRISGAAGWCSFGRSLLPAGDQGTPIWRKANQNCHLLLSVETKTRVLHRERRTESRRKRWQSGTLRRSGGACSPCRAGPPG